MAVAPTKRSLDLFGTLNRLSKKDFFVWDNLTEDERKEFVHLIIMRWMSGTSDERQLRLLNGIVNTYVFNIPNHKSLLTKLMAISATGKTFRYKWMKLEAGKEKAKPLSLKVLCAVYGFSMKHANTAIVHFDVNDIIQMAKDLGYQDDELKKIQKEFK